MDARLDIVSVVSHDSMSRVRDAVSLLLAWHRRAPSGTPVRWVLPGDGPVSAAEAEQLLGLVAAVTRAGTASTRSGRLEVEVEGVARPEAVAFVVRWPGSALTVDGLVPKALEQLASLPRAVGRGLHLVDVGPGAESDPLWRHNVDLVAAAAAVTSESAAFGVAVPPPPFTGIDTAVAELRRLLGAHGLGAALSAVRVRGPLYATDSSALHDFAARHSLQIDLSLVQRGSSTSDPQPYIESGAYRPQPFDLRSPRLGSSGPLLELPRHDARHVLRDLLDRTGEGHLLSNWLFGRATEASLRRLEPVLDRGAQSTYLSRVNVDLSLIGEWSHYFVHNWAPPPSHRLALLEVNALDLVDRASLLRRAYARGVISDGDARLVPVVRLLAMALEQADVQARGGAEQALRDQVEGHGYLAEGGRPEMSGDSRCLLPLLPQRMGRTLEIGCGYGVFAREVAAQADLYVGVDLLVEQAQALRALGAQGVPADMHRLPFVDEAFDTVVADNVLEHSYEPLALLRELHRVLRPNGSLLGVLPPDLASPAHSLRLHLWKTDRLGLESALAQAGFAMERYDEVAYARVGSPGSFPSSHERTMVFLARRSAAAAAPEPVGEADGEVSPGPARAAG